MSKLIAVAMYFQINMFIIKVINTIYLFGFIMEDWYI